MKKILFLLSFFLVVGLNANAQKCAKTCAKKCSKEKSASLKTLEEGERTTKVAAAYMEADVAAESNEMIEKRVCAKSGMVSYYEKSVCAKSQKVSFNEVKYCTDSKKFVNMSPLSADAEGKVMSVSDSKTACAAGCTKECCAGVSKKACSKMSKKECAKKCASKKTKS